MRTCRCTLSATPRTILTAGLAVGFLIAPGIRPCWGDPYRDRPSDPTGEQHAVVTVPLGLSSVAKCSSRASRGLTSAGFDDATIEGVVLSSSPRLDGTGRKSNDLTNGRPITLVRPLSAFVASHGLARIDAAVQHDLLSPRFLLPPGPMLVAGGFDEFASEDKDRVSVSRAALFSLVLPGAGQWYAGARGRAAAFLAAEGICWAAFGFFETVGKAKKADYQTYARVHAGIDPTGKGDDFYRTITFYDSREEYNDLARVFDQRRPYYSDVPYWHWQWDADASRSTYRNFRNQSNEAFNRGKFTLGALALNRLIAALDAIRTARSVNRRARMETANWRIDILGAPVTARPHLAVILSRQF